MNFGKLTLFQDAYYWFSQSTASAADDIGFVAESILPGRFFEFFDDVVNTKLQDVVELGTVLRLEVFKVFELIGVKHQRFFTDDPLKHGKCNRSADRYECAKRAGSWGSIPLDS